MEQKPVCSNEWRFFPNEIILWFIQYVHYAIRKLTSVKVIKVNERQLSLICQKSILKHLWAFKFPKSSKIRHSIANQILNWNFPKIARETLKYHISEKMQNKVKGIRLKHHDCMLDSIILCKYCAHYFHISARALLHTLLSIPRNDSNLNYILKLRDCY